MHVSIDTRRRFVVSISNKRDAVFVYCMVAIVTLLVMRSVFHSYSYYACFVRSGFASEPKCIDINAHENDTILQDPCKGFQMIGCIINLERWG